MQSKHPIVRCLLPPPAPARHLAGVMQTLLSVAVLLLSPLPNSGPGCHLSPGTEGWHCHRPLPALAEQCPTRTGSRDPGRSHPALIFPSDCMGLWALTQLMEQRDYGKGSSLIRGIQKCNRLWKEHNVTSSLSSQGSGGLSKQKVTPSSASTEFAKAGPGPHVGALWYWQWLCCDINPGVKESVTGPAVFPLHLRPLVGASRLYCPSSRSPRG